MSSKVRFWEPLWSTSKPKPMDQDEMATLDFVARATDLEIENLEPVLDIRSRKVLRVKVFKSREYDRNTYDYLFFGPVNFNGKNIFLAENVPGQFSRNGKPTVNIINTEQVIAKIKREVNMMLAAQERLKKKAMS